jgi:hypothetical protein
MERFLRNGFGHGRHPVVQGRRQGGRAVGGKGRLIFLYSIGVFE